MAITVKDINGAERNVASRGMSGTALGLSIGALGSMLLGGTNGFNGILGGSNECTVSQKDFYEVELLDRDREFANYMSLQQQICDLKAEVAVNSTANTYQNMLTDKQFKCVDKQMDWDRIATTYQIGAAVCDKIPGQLTLPLSALSNGFKANDNYLATYNSGYCGYGYNSCCGNYGW